MKPISSDGTPSRDNVIRHAPSVAKTRRPTVVNMTPQVDRVAGQLSNDQTPHYADLMERIEAQENQWLLLWREAWAKKDELACWDAKAHITLLRSQRLRLTQNRNKADYPTAG